MDFGKIEQEYQLVKESKCDWIDDLLKKLYMSLMLRFYHLLIG